MGNQNSGRQKLPAGTAKVTLSFRCAPCLAQKIRKAAAYRGESPSEQIIRILEKHFYPVDPAANLQDARQHFERTQREEQAERK